MKNFDPESIVLDEEEQWIEDHLEEFVPVENQEEMRRQMQIAAHNTMKKIRAREKENKSGVVLRSPRAQLLAN